MFTPQRILLGMVLGLTGIIVVELAMIMLS